MTNVERMAKMAAKFLGYGVHVHINLHVVKILGNMELAAQQTWGAEISVSHRKIVSKYPYNYVHDAESIRKFLQILATADATRYQIKAKAPGELSDMLSQGMTRIQHMVQHQPEPQPYQSESNEVSAHATTISDSEGPVPRREWRGKKREATQLPLPLPVHAPITPTLTPPPKEEKELHTTGLSDAQVGDGTKKKIKGKIWQVASIPPSTEGMALLMDRQTTSHTQSVITTRTRQGGDQSGSARNFWSISRSTTGAPNGGVGIGKRHQEIRTHG